MLPTVFLDRILDVLNVNTDQYDFDAPPFQKIKVSDEESKTFLCVLKDFMGILGLPIRHKDVPSFLSLYKDSFRYREEFDYLYQRTNHFYFKAVTSEFLWSLEHKREQAEAAVHAYLSLLTNRKVNVENFCAVMCSICRIVSKCRGMNFQLDGFWDICAEYIKSSLGTEGYCPQFVLLGLLECEIRPGETEQLFLDAITHFESIKDRIKAIAYREELIAFYKTKKRPCTQLYINNAHDYESQALELNSSNPVNALRIIELIHSAMKAWTDSNAAEAKKNRERLARFLKPIKESIPKNMVPISAPPIDISDAVQAIEEQVNSSTFEEVLWIIAHSLYLRGLSHFQQQKRPFLSSLFTERILDSKGKIRANVPGGLDANTESRRAIAQREAYSYYCISVKTITYNYLYSCKDKFCFTVENLRFLVDSNTFIPEDRKDTFLKGIVAGFAGDWSAAMHLLMPQVENAIRCLAEDCDIITYKTYESGVEECLSLSKILSLPELKEYLEEDLIFNMEVFYTSEYAFGLRDRIGHGLISDAELNSYSSMAVWCFTLHLCCIYCPELRIRLIENKHENPETE